MAGRSISAYTDDLTYERVSRLAKSEDRSTAQIVAAAVRLYVQMPTRAHDAFRRLESAGDDTVRSAARAAGRALLNEDYEALASRRRPQTTQSPEAGEEDILAQAVEAARLG